MTTTRLTRRQQVALRRYQKMYEEKRAELDDLGFILQGSVTQRWMECGKPTCHCHEDPGARHGPYYQLSWKRLGRTSSVYLTKEQAALCRKWLKNNRRLERMIKRLRDLSLRVAQLYKIPVK